MSIPEYKVKAFIPTVKGCGATDKGWDGQRCMDFQTFLNAEATEGWKLHSSEYREVKVTGGCGGTQGVWLVCIFERERQA